MQNQPKLFINKKIILVISAVMIAIAIAIGVFAVVNIVSSNNDKKQSATELKAAADELKARAIKAQESDNDAKAEELLEQAKQQYELAGDKNNAVDAEALLFLSEHAE